ncbi:MAG: DUF6468 domain-containing protein [Rhodospirillaceae bacterium]|nr:DUF6468 domain-containing protein [Rhodospirillaceae bacterium]
MTTETILDLIVIMLLIPTIGYAVVLNRRLSALRKSRDELAKVVANFNDATLRAEAGIPKLKKATNEANMALKDRVEKAQSLRDDLAFMIERADELATKLESAVRVARSESAFGAAAGQPAVAATTAPATPTLAGGLRPSLAPEPAIQPRAAGKAPAAGPLAFEDTALDLRNALNAARAEARANESRLTEARPAAAAPGAAPRAARRSVADELSLGEDRSEAERELLKALQSAR